MAILPHISSCRAWGKTERIVSNITPCDMKCKVYVPLPPCIDDGLLTVFLVFTGACHQKMTIIRKGQGVHSARFKHLLHSDTQRLPACFS